MSHSVILFVGIDWSWASVRAFRDDAGRCADIWDSHGSTLDPHALLVG